MTTAQRKEKPKLLSVYCKSIFCALAVLKNFYFSFYLQVKK